MSSSEQSSTNRATYGIKLCWSEPWAFEHPKTRSPIPTGGDDGESRDVSRRSDGRMGAAACSGTDRIARTSEGSIRRYSARSGVGDSRRSGGAPLCRTRCARPDGAPHAVGRLVRELVSQVRRRWSWPWGRRQFILLDANPRGARHDSRRVDGAPAHRRSKTMLSSRPSHAARLLCSLSLIPTRRSPERIHNGALLRQRVDFTPSRRQGAGLVEHPRSPSTRAGRELNIGRAHCRLGRPSCHGFDRAEVRT
jgi:hypothetical protein